MARGSSRTWTFEAVAPKLVERIGPAASATLDVYQAIDDAIFGEPVGTNLHAR
jgi:hypothetical protein